MKKECKKPSIRKPRLVNSELVNTWESLDKIEEQYINSDIEISEESSLIIDYINTLPEFDRKIFYLYTEYLSYRKVAEETNVGKDIIRRTLLEIQKDILSDFHIVK